MTKKIDTSGLITIYLMKQDDGSVKGRVPGLPIVTWPAHQSGKPTRSHKRVMLNCCWWLPLWVDSLEPSVDLASERMEAAQAAYVAYDFGSDSVNDADGWDTTDPHDFTRLTYGEEGRYNLHVTFEPGTATIKSVEAYCMATGNLIGSMPDLHKEAQA